MDGPEKTTPPLRPHEYLVTIGKREMRVYCPPDGRCEVDGKSISARSEATVDGIGMVEVDGRVYRILHETNGSERDVSLSVNGKNVAGTIDDQRSLLRLRMQASQGTEGGSFTVKAPMPGLVLKVLVKLGATVSKGDGLLVLEAMKMENEVKADRSGRVESISVSERQPVEKGSLLMTFHQEP